MFRTLMLAGITASMSAMYVQADDSAHSAHNTALFNGWLKTYGDLAANAAKNLQPIWSLPHVKVAHFKDAYAASVERVQNIANQLGLTVPASITA